MLLPFLSYFLKAHTVYDVHSPFVFELANAVLEDDRQFYAFREIEWLRTRALSDRTPVPVLDYGAGSRKNRQSHTTVSAIARHAAVTPYKGRLLFRLVQFLHPASILELGTSLGFSALYLHGGARNTPITTLEGNPAIAEIARRHFRQTGAGNIAVQEGNFDQLLPVLLENKPDYDFIYLDGNHRYEPTLRYFDWLLPKVQGNTVIVLDDIYWSGEMKKAWETISSKTEVKLSVDLFFVGIVFFKPEFREKQHFVLAPSRWKPWRTGIFHRNPKP